MSGDFLSPENDCGSALLNLVARASTLMAQLQRLQSHVPKIFISPGKKYQKILHDFSYFDNMNEIQSRIQQSTELVELNESLSNTYLPLLERFYQLFQEIYFYYENLTRFIDGIKKDKFMSFSLKDLFEILEGKQLACEAVYLFGAMLLLMDYLIEGKVRERMVIFYYRNKGGENIPRSNEVRHVCRDTGYLRPSKRSMEYVRPDHYPQDFFAKFPIDQDMLEMIKLAIKDQDIYKQMSAFPQAKLRSFALANQGSIIFVVLFFMPQVLRNDRSTMREIVDKHFFNCWVITYYLGHMVDLTEWWKPYKAARLALNNNLDVDLITQLSSTFGTTLNQCHSKCKEYLTEGVLTDQFVIYNLNDLMNTLRYSNICLRWLILHRNTTNPKLKELVNTCCNEFDILRLLLLCAEFENSFKEICVGLLSQKQLLWGQDRDTCGERLGEIAAYFGEEHSLGKIESNESLKSWFAQIAQAISKVSFSNSTYASRRIQNFINALDDIEEYDQVGSNIQIKKYLYDTKRDLDHMVKIVHIKESTITSIEIITDSTWIWVGLKDYIRLLQKEIRKDPDTALLLKNTFTKISSILNTPMLRIIQAKSLDIESVSEFYSNELIKIVKDVLQIIPQLVFENLSRIIEIFTKMVHQPQKFDKAQLTLYAQFDERIEIAKLTNEVSLFAAGIFDMETYLLGVVQLNPRHVLQEGIRKELIKLISRILEQSICVECKTPEAFHNKINRLSLRLQNFKLSLEYIQDFVHIFGLQFFYNQYEKLIYSYVDIEKNNLLNKGNSFEKLNYDESIPMPTIKHQKCSTFIGWILNQLLSLTNSKKSNFLVSAYGFYNYESGREIITLKSLNILNKCIGIGGLQGMDHLLGNQIHIMLKQQVKDFAAICHDESNLKILNHYFSSLKYVDSFTERFDNALLTLGKTFRTFCTQMTSQLIEIGQRVLLRDVICLQLRMLSKVGASRLYLVLDNINKSIMNDMKQNQKAEQTDEQLINSNILLTLLNSYFSHMGMLEPTKKVYTTFKPIQYVALLLFTILSQNIGNIDYDSNLKSLVRVKKDSFQPTYFMAGLLCFLQQLPASCKQQFFSFMASYIKNTINFIMTNKEVSKKPQLVGDLFTYIRFFEECIKYSKESYEKYKEIIDLGLFSSLDRETLKNGYKLY